MGKNIAVIGGGAAGMMAALRAADGDCQVTIFEKNEKLGKKIYITGKGRCNVTNACDAGEFFGHVVSNPKFLYSAFYGYNNEKVCQFFEEHGCPLKTERGERVFPVSDHASDIIRALERTLREKGVRICLSAKVKRILTKPFLQAEAEDAGCLPKDRKTGKKKEAAACLEVCGLELSDGTAIQADAVILATGGLSYPTTGSDGEGFGMAEELSHTVVNCSPSLVPFETAEKWCHELSGLSLKNVELSLRLGEKEIYSGFGEMLFTHFGVSGPLILSASSYYSAEIEKLRLRNNRKKKQDAAAECQIFLNLKPALTAQQLDKRLLRDFEAAKNKNFRNALDGLFPSRLVPVMVELSGIDPNKKVHEITKEERREFAALIQHLPLTVTGTRGYEEAVITRGGIKVQEVNPSTMESRLVKNLYFAGEMLDVDALTGGFNLQIAWSTGYLAGESAAQIREEEI